MKFSLNNWLYKYVTVVQLLEGDILNEIDKKKHLNRIFRRFQQ